MVNVAFVVRRTGRFARHGVVEIVEM